jgi:hypothetical protein
MPGCLHIVRSYKREAQNLDLNFSPVFFFFFFFVVVVLGVHYGIFKSSYIISYLNSPPPSFSIVPPSATPGIVPFFDYGLVARAL